MPSATQNTNILQALESFANLSLKERALFLNVAGTGENEIAIEYEIDDVPTEKQYRNLILKDHAKKVKHNIEKYKNTRGISNTYSKKKN